MNILDLGSLIKNFLKTVSPSTHFTPKQIRVYLLCVCIVTLLTVGIIASVKFYKIKENRATINLKTVFSSEEMGDLLRRPNIGDFVFPDGLIREQPPKLLLGLVTEDDFDESEWVDFMKKYWIDPSIIDIADLPSRNQKVLEEYLEKAAEKDPNF